MALNIIGKPISTLHNVVEIGAGSTKNKKATAGTVT